MKGINKKNTDYIKELFVPALVGELTEEERTLLADWLNADEKNLIEYQQFESSWLLLNQNIEYKNLEDGSQWLRLQRQLHRENEPSLQKKSFLLLRFSKYAAAWLLTFAMGGLSVWNFKVGFGGQNQEPQLTEITVPLGSKSQLKLPDGSKVWLNAGSRISFDRNFNRKDRQLTLSGEAFFQVATNKDKPFTVISGNLRVRAFGTKFNVKAYPEENTMTTTLEEGKIDVSLLDKGKTARVITLIPKQKVIYRKGMAPEPKQIHPGVKTGDVKEGEELVYFDEVIGGLAVSSNVRTELYSSWKDKRWLIEGYTFSQLIPLLERRYNVKIEMKDHALFGYKFTGTIQDETIEQVLEALKYTAPVNYTLVQNQIRLSVDTLSEHQFGRIIKPRK